MRKTEGRKNHTEIWEEEDKKPMGLSVSGKPNLGGIKSILIVILFAGVAVLGLFLNIAGRPQGITHLAPGPNTFSPRAYPI